MRARRVEHLEDALAAGHGALEHRVLHDQLTNRVEEARDVDDERGQVPIRCGDVDRVGVDRAQAADE